MALFRNFFSKNKKESDSNKVKVVSHKSADGRVHVPMFTSVFGDAKETLLTSNSMLGALMNDIKLSIEPYSLKDEITLDIYETSKSDEFSREMTINNFKRYVHGCIEGLKKQHFGRLALFGSFLLIGIFFEILLYGILGQETTLIPFWLFKSIEVLASLFIWQFGGYMAFEYFGESSKIKRYKQIEKVEFSIKEWD